MRREFDDVELKAEILNFIMRKEGGESTIFLSTR
jgi:hypothetical protein